jgi:GNAT superfamily N-acetyltransferase
MSQMSLKIEPMTAADVEVERPALVALLQDAVESGASVGFLPPLGDREAAAYWATVTTGLCDGSRLLLAARDRELGLVGSAQLELATRANAAHRAEVTKVMVHRRARRRGVGRALMIALEEHARRLGRTTLILDTRQGDPSEVLYRTAGWTFAGAIPEYARSATGALAGTAFYYKVLGLPSPPTPAASAVAEPE